MESDIEKAVNEARGIVTAFLLRDKQMITALAANKKDADLIMALASIAASVVTGLAKTSESDPIELWQAVMAIYEMEQ